MITPEKNTGVIEILPKPEDFKAGDASIVEVVRNSSGDWRSYEPPGEWQKLLGVNVVNDSGFNTGGFDVLACVSFSANDTLETLLGYLIKQGTVDSANIKWLKDNGYFNSDGTLNFSDRFVAKVSGTTKDGNSLPAVWDAIRNNGLIPETMWPFPINEIKENPPSAWDVYYKEIPEDMIAKGKEFLTHFQLQYEWVFYPGCVATHETLVNALKIAPLQIATAVCDPWNTDQPIQGCGAGGQHATMLAFAGDYYHILDHYSPFQKRLAQNYNITYAMRGIITPVAQPTVQQVVNQVSEVVKQVPNQPKEQQFDIYQQLKKVLLALSAYLSNKK